jgi:PKD repeat protein
MKKQIYSTVFALFMLCSFQGWADDTDCQYSTAGTDFWFGLLQNRIKGTAHYLEITVTSQLGATFTITYGSLETSYGGTYTVGANSSQTVRLDYSLMEPSGSESIEEKGIHLVSTNPVNVYSFNYRTQSSDIAVIYPTESLGNEYFAMCYTPNTSNSNESNSEFLIVATVNNTKVQITPSVDTDSGNKAKVAFTVSLNKGQSYQVQSTKNDLTGSGITSDQPIAFYSGSLSTTVPSTGATWDHLYEQISPTSAWGREFYVVPLQGRTKDTYRVLAATDGTVVSIGGTSTKKTLSKGGYYEFELTSSQACKITSTKKVLLAQFCRSQAVDGSSGVGDPFMIMISPVTQKTTDVTFLAYESTLIQNIFYVNIVALTSEVGSITLDGTNVGSRFTAFSGTKYSRAQISITKGSHRLLTTSTSKDGGFLAFIYGFGDNGNTESYGYGVGFNLDIQLDLRGEDLSDTILVCSGDETELDAGSYFDKYSWSTKDTTSSIPVSEEGWYKVTAKTTAGCSLTDSIYVYIDTPETSLGRDTTVCLPGEYTVVAEDGFANYLWQDGSTEKMFTVETTGNYWLTVTNENGCQVTDTVYVQVRMPILGFTPDYPVATLDHPDITFTNNTEGAVDFSWNFGDNSVENTEFSPKHHYSDLGVYHVVLTATSEFGCMDTTGMDIKIVPISFSIPNAFRPDSDILENRIFSPYIVNLNPSNYKLTVYNRVGSTIFESSNYETGWDGNLSNGNNAASGVYVWIINYKDIQGFDHLQKGSVMLVR